MTTIGAVAQQIGLTERDGERGVLMAMVGGQVRHAYLGDALAVDIDAAGDALYHASGLFRADALQGNRGRSAENLTRVLWLPFDADLLDFLGCPPASDPDAKTQRRQLLDELGAMPQDELDTLIAALRTDLEAAFTALGLPLHRLDYTGYGLCAYVYLDETDQPRVGDARTVHKRLVEAINAHAGERLVDPQCSDAGTRVTRIPESTNHKGVLPRLVQSLIPYTGESAPLGVNPEAPRAVGRMIPANGPGLAAADADAIVAAIRPSWAHGQRHALALAVAAMLAKAGVPEEQAAAMIAALAGGDDDEPRDRRTAVASTYRRARQGAAIAGYTQLARLLPAAAVAFVDATLDCYRQAAVSGSVSVGMFEVVGSISESVRQLRRDARLSEDERDGRISDLFPLPPENSYFGSFGRWRDLIAPTTEAPEAFHLGVALTVFGSMMERRIGVEYNSEPLYGNLYTTLIGATGKTRKDTAIKRVLHVAQRGEGFRNIVPGYHIAKDVSSAEGLVATVKEHRNTLFYLTELSHLQKNAQRKGTRTIMDRLIEAWDTPTVLSNLSKGNPIQAHNPFVSIIAATQPARLADNMTDEDIESGFANRWLFIFGKRRPPMSRPPKVDWRAAWDLYAGWYDAINSYAEGTVLEWDGTADELWDSWYFQTDRSRNDDEDAMSIRHPVLVQKLAVIFAVSERAQAINVRHVAPAIALVDWTWAVVRELMKGWGVGIESQIELTVTQALKRFGPMYRRDLQQKCSRRRWSGRDFANVFRAMAENGVVEVDAMGVVNLPGHAAAERSSA